jgi:hypothetical protein
MRHRETLIRSVVGPVAAFFCALANPVQAQERTAAPSGLIDEPSLIERAVIFADRRQGNGEFTNGFYPDVWNMIPGAGWISGGPGYRHWYAKDRVFVDASAAVSWRGYKTVQGRFELPRVARSRLAVGSQFRWQDLTQVSFFGVGAESARSNRSEYRFKSHNLVGYATFRPVEWAAIGAQIGWLRPSILPRSGWFESDRPHTRDVFAADPVFALAGQPTFLQREASVTADTRDFPRHPTRGGVYRAAAANYADSDGVFSFRRYEAEAAHFVPLANSRLVVALHGWLVASDTSDGQAVPFYLQPSLGGHNTLRAYPDYRFHDRNLIVINAEGRIAMMAHVDAAVFVDAGNVAPRVADLNLDKRSYGAGLRLHTRRQTFARLDVARGSEGWGALFRLTDPLDLSRLSRRALVAPFVP